MRCPVGGTPRGTWVGCRPAGYASIIPRSKRPVARRKPSEERGMGSAASLIKAHEEETNGRAAPLRTAPRYIAGTGPSPDDAGWIRSGCDSIRLYAKEQDLVGSISTRSPRKPRLLWSSGARVGSIESIYE